MTILSRILVVLALSAAAGGATFALNGSPASAAGDCVAGSDWGTVRDDLASQTVGLVNAHRAALGLRQLAVVPALQGSAVWKARHMAKYSYMAHSDPAPPVARSTGERMSACGYGAGWGENIAYGYATAQSVVSGWLASPGHRANIENPSFVGIGAGAATSASGQVYWAHTFGTSSAGAAAPPPPAPPPPAPAPSPPAPAPAPAPKPPAPAPPPPAPAPAPKAPAPAPSPTPSAPARAAAPPTATAAPTPAPTERTGSAVEPLTLRNLTLTHRPSAGGVLATTVAATKDGVRLRTGHVFCSARFEGRPLKILVHRLRAGAARCAWALPKRARGATVSAVVIVQQGRVRVEAPFRTAIS
jgi:uncharacterized protein YkwD